MERPRSVWSGYDKYRPTSFEPMTAQEVSDVMRKVNAIFDAELARCRAMYGPDWFPVHEEIEEDYRDE